MRVSIACVFAVALFLSGCSEDIQGGGPFPFGPNHVLDVTGVWRYEAEVVKDDCSFLFCSECHREGTENILCSKCHREGIEDVEDVKHHAWYKYIRGSRTIRQDGEDLFISDHIINTSMGVEMQGTVRVYSGDFLCGQSVVDESGTTLLYTEDGSFHSNDNYESTLALSSSRDGPICKVIWSVTGRRVD